MTIEITDANSAGLENKVRRNLFIYLKKFVAVHTSNSLVSNFYINIVDISVNKKSVNTLYSRMVNINRVGVKVVYQFVLMRMSMRFGL